MATEVNELFGTDVEVAEDVVTVRVVLGRGDDAEIHEFPITDILQEGDDASTIADDTLKARVEEHMADAVDEGGLDTHKVARPATGTIVVAYPNVYGKSKAEILEQAKWGGYVPEKHKEWRRVKELSAKELVKWEAGAYRLTEKARDG